ncbi:hypothetical protein FSARC_12234 [Fusarium sarcochroum]|uniref:Uncharacterized protein n=1 Tax=Fusarium sarcochroum TaxID=1208366 RepID=A0A8H4T9U5_9HYPO|nr:hypothetical protein FSARC_12234 [Fusarium sarcochroum]
MTSSAHDGTAPAGALTTIFTPPVDCIKDRVLYYKTRTCMPLPERWSLYWEAASYYSPGICPSGMISVATPPPFFGPPIEPSETAIVCCPSGYTLSGSSDKNSCTGPVTVSSYELVDIVTTLTTGASTSIKTSVARSYYNTTRVNSIYPIQVRWRESDLAVLETHPLSPGVTPTSTQESDPGGDESEDRGKLSSGAIAGIVIGALAFVMLVCVAGFLLHRRRKTKRFPQENGIVHTGSPIVFPKTTSPQGHMPTSDIPPTSSGAVPLENEDTDTELRRITDRRARLLELERLDQEEAQLRRQRDERMPSELSSGVAVTRLVEID